METYSKIAIITFWAGGNKDYKVLYDMNNPTFDKKKLESIFLSDNEMVLLEYFEAGKLIGIKKK